jgi:beta-galactosidase
MRRSLFLAIAILTTHAFAALHLIQPRSIQSLDSDWRFSQSDPADAKSSTFDDAQWKPVTLPHDWSIAGPVKEDAPSRAAGGFFPTGVAWYRHSLTLPQLDPAKRTFIAFDGIMANSDVYCNGELLGHRPYGYVSFNYDLTRHLHAGENIIAVRVDDSQQPASRWYTGAGINRHVRLITTSAVHIAPWGSFVTTPTVSAQSATVHVRTTITNDSAASANIRLSISVRTPGDGTLSGSFITLPKPLTLAAGATANLEADATIADPDRWDLNHPALYKVVATILENGKPIDDEVVPFGIREFHFDPDQGFFLNGVHHKIYGVALHTDAGALGTAVPLAAWQRRLIALRALGVNAIRTAHNPPAPEFLDLADRMGFLVMDEMFDCWTVAKNPYDYHLYFKEWSLRDTADTVRRDRNHPSIILWSAGNEIHDTPKPDVAIPILKSLVDTFHANDPTRPVTQALFRPNVSHDYDNGLADLLDVVGQNYREQEILAAHAQKPTRKIIGTENTHDRNQWVAMRDHPEYSGQFLWSGIDYLGEARRWPSIGAGSGLLDRTSTPKPRGFERESWWSTRPNIHVVRRVAPPQRSATDPGYEPVPPTGDTTRYQEPLFHDWMPTNTAPHTETVEVYTNAEEAELFQGGTSLGIQQRHPDASPLVWQVPYRPGELQAVGRTNGRVVAGDRLQTPGKPAHLNLVPLHSWVVPNLPLSEGGHSIDDLSKFLTPEWDDVLYVTATLTDSVANPIPDSSTPVTFTLTGPAELVATDSGSNIDHTPFASPTRNLFAGTAIAILRATASSGTITLTATTPGLPPSTLTLTALPPGTPSGSQRSF